MQSLLFSDWYELEVVGGGVATISDDLLVCRDCNKLLPLSMFRRNNAKRLGRERQCNPCHRLYCQKHWIDVLIRGARRRAIKKGLLCDLDQHRDELAELWKDKRCQILGAPLLVAGQTEGRVWNSATIDRIDNKGHYQHKKKNVRLVCWFMNNLLSSFGEEESQKHVIDWLRLRGHTVHLPPELGGYYYHECN